MVHAWGRMTLIVFTVKCIHINVYYKLSEYLHLEVRQKPVLSSDFLSVKETVKENVPVDTDS